MRIFKNRVHAGQVLSEKLSEYGENKDVIILALPRGGVPVAFEVSRKIGVEMDLLLVRKLGVPGNEELAMGAIASGNIRVLNEDIIKSLHIPDKKIDQVTDSEKRELDRRNNIYRANRPIPDLRNRTVILIDDGLATGATMRAAAEAVRTKGPSQIIVAVPTCSPDAYNSLEDVADEIICAISPEPFFGVGRWYEDFRQVSDEEVCDIMDKVFSSSVNN
ncbi:phosphoribosyltransferase [Methanosalsum zhilinae DSM 4017]|uniref:Phosphoribosyltransferase n=1 Tax=Methanosalsum zhilinae (strain DSM 4017 / NBRC 107636 / OCM 62 / WeN5) TaxID=679901 RepID=F7XKD1_METZD|nr:phosphoribosyltransferase [Methanosalsum zhilinae]AEH61699.1 phosphoribosyltransferase [Methanosalsum zhilinae DSM 4017]